MAYRIRRAGHLVLRVTDVQRMKSFLENVVGFTTYGQASRDFFFLTSNPVTNHHMIAIRGGKAGERLPDAARQIGMVSIAYEMTDVSALHELRKRIVDATEEYKCRLLALEDRGAIYNLVFSDADGNWYEFWCPAPGDAGADDRSSLALRGKLSVDAGLERAAGATPGLPGKPAIRGTSHMTLRCRDLAKSREFYETTVGLVLVAHDERGRQYFSGDANSKRFVLALEPAADTGAPLPAPKAMYGMEHYSLEVGSFPELQAVYRRFKSLNVDIDHTIDHGVTASVYFHDPDGNLMEVYHDIPRAEIPVPENPFASYGDIDARLDQESGAQLR